MNWVDVLTKRLNHALDILFIKNPVGTAMGSIFGIIIDTIIKIYRLIIEPTVYKTLISVDWWRWVLIGIFAFNIPNLIYSLFERKRFNPSIEKGFVLLKEAEKSGNFTKEQIKNMYRQFYLKILENIELNDKAKKEMDFIEQISNKVTLS